MYERGRMQHSNVPFVFSRESGNYYHPYRELSNDSLVQTLKQSKHCISAPYGPVQGSEYWNKLKACGFGVNQDECVISTPARDRSSEQRLSLQEHSPTTTRPLEPITVYPKHVQPTDHTNMIEILPDRLYMLAMDSTPVPDHHSFYFKVNHREEYKYWPFTHDYGPLDLSCTSKLSERLSTVLRDYPSCRIFLWIQPDNRERRNVNQALLLNYCGIFVQWLIYEFNMCPAEALLPFENIKFLDNWIHASQVESPFRMTLRDVAEGFSFANKLGWTPLTNSEWLRIYDHYKELHNGDLHVIVPGKLLAFSSPVDKMYQNDNLPAITGTEFARILAELNVKVVVRLNDKLYDENAFLSKGIQCYDMSFPDGSIPNIKLIRSFMDLVDSVQEGLVAVHCKAGLGRTGTMIGSWVMKHFNFPGRGWIAYNRLVRPGSILGPQQNFLSKLKRADLLTPDELLQDANLPEAPVRNAAVQQLDGPESSPLMRKIALEGELGQSNYLRSGGRNANPTFSVP